MSTYSHENGRFVLSDYQSAKTFCSFLPAVAGADGKPLWAFYANVGQCLGGFGVSSKDTPMTPFDSAAMAYRNIPVVGFRTFLKIDGALKTPFFNSGVADSLSVGKADLEIKEEGDDYVIEISYSTLSHYPYPCLMRTVRIINRSSVPHAYEFIDGLPIFFPHGVNNYCYKELTTLEGAYCKVENLEKKAPLYRFTSSTDDTSEIRSRTQGNAFLAVDEKGKPLDCLVDPALVFGNDLAFLSPRGWQGELFGKKQQTENKLPSAFAYGKVALEGGESYEFVEFFASFETKEQYECSIGELTLPFSKEQRRLTSELIDGLLSPAFIQTGKPELDGCYKQSYLDNCLRGGFPTILPGDQPYYLFGRKHGDMERDYNAFNIPSSFYSSGPGNFRDVNQNRRCDLFFVPALGDYNVRLFFSLLQFDGNNPLTVKPQSFHLKGGTDLAFLENNPNKAILLEKAKNYTPSSLFSFLSESLRLEKEEAARLFALILSSSTQTIEAEFGEGYWVDHWTYNLDLLENYSAVFPDKEETLFFSNDYPYFYAPIYVEPKKNKTCLREDGQVRQYGAISKRRSEEIQKQSGISIHSTSFLTDKNGVTVYTNLATKILHLFFVKFTCLDQEQLGIEMEADKPGWNDALNGLPGLFASSLNETIELLRLGQYALKHLSPFQEKEVALLNEQVALILACKSNVESFLENKIGRRDFYLRQIKAREELRESAMLHVKGQTKSLSLSSLLSLVESECGILEKAIKRAKELGKGILPSYLLFLPKKWHPSQGNNALGYPCVEVEESKLTLIPMFLEASARAYKLGPSFMSEQDYLAIKESGCYDPILHCYKTCADLKDAPFEIGRIHSFTKGWLEKECNFLHMTYKYLLGLLRCGLYEEFFQEAKQNLTCFLDPRVYGRDPHEASSFIVPTNNPDPSKWGQGFFARLTGANAEFLNLVCLLFLGENPFFLNKEGALCFEPKISLSKEFFDKKGDASFLLFSSCLLCFHNPGKKDAFADVALTYEIEGKRYSSIQGDLATAIREGKVPRIDIFLA